MAVDVLKDKQVEKLELKETQELLDALYKGVEEQGYWEEKDREDLKELEDHIKKLWGWSSETSEEKWEFKEMSLDDAKTYLGQIKGKSWTELRSEGTKWIGAVQVVLNGEQKSNLVVDWNLWKKRSKTRAAVAEFQKKNGLTPDWLPWKNTIQALLWERPSGKKEWGSSSSEKKEDGDVKTIKDDNWTFVWTVDGDGKPLNGTYTDKDGESFKVENWDIK